MNLVAGALSLGHLVHCQLYSTLRATTDTRYFHGSFGKQRWQVRQRRGMVKTWMTGNQVIRSTFKTLSENNTSIIHQSILQEHHYTTCREKPKVQIRRPGSACTVFFSYVASKILSQGAHPKSPVQNPKSKIPKIQNPQNPKSKIPKIPKSQNPNFAHKDLLHNVPKIQNPKSPKSRKSKIPKIQNPQNPKSQNPKSPQSKIQNPQNQNPQNPKSKIPKIQNPQNPKSSAEIQNLGRWGPHVKNCFLMMQNPKSKISKIRPKKLGFWILGILDFGDFGFGDFGFWIVGILDFGFWDFGAFGFWILGFWGFWILGFWILGILDFGDFGFWGGPGHVPLGNLVTGLEVRGSKPPWSAFEGHFKTNCI